MDDQQLSELIEGLKMNNLDVYSHMINGYIGSDKFLKQLKSTVIDMKKKNPNLVFVCDPVMGDMGPGKAIYIWLADKTQHAELKLLSTDPSWGERACIRS